MAWSNGTTTHLQQKQLKELEKDFYHQWAHYNHRVEQGYEWEIDEPINYHHRNLSRFRYLVSRCWERVREDPTLEPLLANSTAYDWFLEMEQKYADCKGTGWIG